MFSSKQKTKACSHRRVKKVRKFILKFFSEVSTGVRDRDDDDGEDERVLSCSSIDNGEHVDDYDDNKSDGSSVGDDNNKGNNDADRGTYGVADSQRVSAISWDLKYSLEGHMQDLSLTYDHGHRPQLYRSTSTSTSFSTYHRDDYNDDFIPHRNSMWK